MKLIDFSTSQRLNSLREEMGAELRMIEISDNWRSVDGSKLAELIEKGEVEIEIDEIKTNDGVFEYEGRKVIVYIRDQYAKYYGNLRMSGYKFHLTKCAAISNAFNNKRDSRYVVSLRTDGQFKINLLEEGVIKKEGLIEPMAVCKYCLGEIDYQGYRTGPSNEKKRIFKNFELKKYFSLYSKDTSLNPSRFRNANDAPINEYPPNWNEISKAERERKHFKCEGCTKNLSKKEHRKFLHVHHRDGDKSNNQKNNLEVLCIKCHSKQPGHDRLKNHPDFNQFLRL